MRWTALLLAALSSGCGLLPDIPFGGGLPSPKQSAPAGGADPISWLERLTDMAQTWWWIGLIALLFLPGLKEPLLHFWSAVFRAVAVPFVAARNWYDRRQEARD